jgi:hypothetical protein
METLNFPYLSKLMNDPIRNDLRWIVVPTKIPSYIPKFEGKSGEDPQYHIMMFHLWFSAILLKHKSIWL